MKFIDNLKSLEKFLEIDLSGFVGDGVLEIETTALPRNASLIVNIHNSAKISFILAVREELEDSL